MQRLSNIKCIQNPGPGSLSVTSVPENYIRIIYDPSLPICTLHVLLTMQIYNILIQINSLTMGRKMREQ